MFGLPQNTVIEVQAIFTKYPSIEEVIIYGSREKGDYKKGSDIDLTMIENSISFPKFLEIENALDDLLLPYKIDLSLKRKITNIDLLSHIDRVGKLFYKRGIV